MNLKRSLAAVCCLAAVSWAQTPVEWAERAMQAEKSGQVQEAEQAWDRAVTGLEKSKDKPTLARACLFRGLFLFDEKKHDAAFASLERARELFVETKNHKGVALAQVQIGEIERVRGRSVQAEARFRAAVAAAERGGDVARKSEALGMLARLLDGAGRWPEATEVYHEIAREQRAISSPQLPKTLVTLGALHQMQDLNRQALEFYAEAAKIGPPVDPLARAAGLQLRLKRWPEALKLYDQLVVLEPTHAAYAANRALVLEEMGEAAAALQAYEQWLGAHPDHVAARDVAERRVKLLYRSGQQAEALALLPAAPGRRAALLADLGLADEAEAVLRDQSDPTLCNQLGKLQVSRGNVAAARASFARGLQGAPDDGALLLNMGETYLAVGETEKALPWITRAVAQLKLSAERATGLNNLAAAQHKLGRWEESLKTLREAEDLLSQAAVTDSIHGTVINQIGYSYAKLGRVEEAMSYYRRALALRRAGGDKRGEVVTLLNMGALLDGEGRNFSLEAEAANRDLGDPALALTIQNNLASLEKDPQKRREGFLRALALAGGNPLMRGTILASLAQVPAGTMAERKAHADEAFGVLSSLGSREQLFVLLPFYASSGAALPTGPSAHGEMLTLLQDLLRGLPARSAGSFIEQHRDELETATAGASGNATELLEFEESIRALAVLAMTREVSLSSDRLPPALVERSRTLQTRLEELLRRPPSRDVNEDIRRLKLEFSLASEEIERLHLSSGALQQARGVKVAELQPALRADEALVEFVSLPDRWVAVVLQPGKIQVVQLGSRAAVDRSLLAAGAMSADRSLDAVLGEVSRQLWLPVAAQLSPAVRRLVIVPAGGLYSVPLAALPFEGQPLIARWQVESASSATAWLLSRRSQSGGKGSLAAALGNLRLPWASRGSLPGGQRAGLSPLPATIGEVNILARLLPGTRVLREKAMTVAELEQGSRGVNLLHLATHGLLDAEQPLLGGLVAADRLVRVADVFHWKLDARLAVLSACNTGPMGKGQQWVGLTRAFQHAGARTLLASLWSVSDQATAEWMGHFYRSLGAGQELSAAVQQACLETRKRYPHPYYWAAFVLWGDGAGRL